MYQKKSTTKQKPSSTKQGYKLSYYDFSSPKWLLANLQEAIKNVANRPSWMAVGQHKEIQESLQLNRMNIDIKNCARCGENHPGLSFIPFTQKLQEEGMQAYTHFAICTISGEPVLLKIENT